MYKNRKKRQDPRGNKKGRGQGKNFSSLSLRVFTHIKTLWVIFTFCMSSNFSISELFFIWEKISIFLKEITVISRGNGDEQYHFQTPKLTRMAWVIKNICIQINQFTFSILAYKAMLGNTWLEIIQMSQSYSDNQLCKGNRTPPEASIL